ncbi:hypothetical protein ACTXT7_001056 [Hymenolepis weldensis]
MGGIKPPKPILEIVFEHSLIVEKSPSNSQSCNRDEYRKSKPSLPGLIKKANNIAEKTGSNSITINLALITPIGQ